MPKKRTSISNEAQLRKKVRNVLKQIHENEDAHEMDKYRRFFRRNVSIFRRAYFTAYLLKQMAENEVPLDGESTNGQEDKTTLFVSVGKNRRVFPRDLVGLFSEVDGINGDHIGQIKILDNYSFVEIEPELAESVIGSLHGREYRGRKLTVNYARKKN